MAQRLDCSKRLLINRGVGRNKWLSIQIDSDRKFESTRSGPRFRGTGDPGKNFHENSLPSRDPRGANNLYFCCEGCIASIRRVKLTHARAATRKKIFRICNASDQAEVRPNPYRTRHQAGPWCTQLQILDPPVKISKFKISITF